MGQCAISIFFCKTTNGAPPEGAPLVTWITNGAFRVGAPLVSGQQQDILDIHPSIRPNAPTHTHTLSLSLARTHPNPRRLLSSPRTPLSLAAVATHAARFRRAPAARSTPARSPWSASGLPPCRSAAPPLARVLHPLLFAGIRHGRPRRGHR